MLFTFYAIDHERAEQKAEEILKKYPYERFDLKAYPHGFKAPRSWADPHQFTDETSACLRFCQPLFSLL